MYADELTKPYTAQETNLNTTTKTPSQLDSTRPGGTAVPDLVIAWSSLGFSLILVFIFMMLSKVWTATQNEIFINLNGSKQVPCRNCRFFSGNAYLKCAVNPSSVLTNEANNCSDYCPKDEQSSPLKE